MTFKTSAAVLAAALGASALAAYALPGGQATQAPAPAGSAAARANAIAFKFYAKAPATGNLFFSPYSINSAFAMTHEGAAGPTAEEMQKVFNFNPDKAAGRAEYEALAKEVAAAAAGSEFVQANSYWAQNDYKFLPDYLKTVTGVYAAEARAADFKTAAETARKEINAWTAEKTKGRIKELFPQGALDALTRLVLVNAVYFKGTWETAFPKNMTAPGNFTLRAGAVLKVPLMTYPKNRDFEYGETAGLQTLRLPYKGGSLAMLIALPADKKAFAAFEKSLSQAKLDELRRSLSTQKVKVFLPRFTFSSAFSLNGTLGALGMPTAFTDAADFSGMDGTRKLYIQKALHKAFVEVNEEGTEAAAATGVAMGIKSMDFDFALFRADRPFVFFIEDTKSGAVLFMGRVDNPLK